MIRALTAVATALAFTLAGCGQKGPLRIPDPAAGQPEAVKPAPAAP
ncbi:MAG: lipoprotein [Pseudomonadota bacterium]|nr:lipoprotein [Pseudomonadota bacterium]